MKNRSSARPAGKPGAATAKSTGSISGSRDPQQGLQETVLQIPHLPFEAVTVMVNALASGGMPGFGLGLCDAAEKQSGRSPELLLLRAECLAADGHRSEATKLAEMALSLPGGNLPSGFDRASAYHESCGEIQNAFDLAERGLALYPLDGRLRLRTGLLSAQLGQPERAVTDLAQVLRQSPDQSIETYAGFAEAAEQTQSHKLCAEILASVIDRVGTRAEPDHDALLRALAGRALRKAGRPAEARALLTEAVGSGNSLPDWARWELQHASWQDTARR